MATETLSPESIGQQLNLTGSVTDIQDDPDSPDANWMLWDGSGNIICRVLMPTPSGNPTTGAGLQEYRILIRNVAIGVNSTSWALQLYENNSQLSELATGSDPAEAGEVVVGTWDATLLTTPDGSLVEMRLIQTAGATGNPGNQKGIDVGAMEWNVTFDVGGGSAAIPVYDATYRQMM